MGELIYVNYEQFGAVGDGKTNDFAAIMAAHNYANENHLPVKTDSSKTYYISDTRIDGEVKKIVIKTNADFGETHFIIDDSSFTSVDGTKVTSSHVFLVESDYPMETVTDREILSKLDGMREGVTKIDLKLGYPALIIPYDENKHVYGRSGAGFKGSAQALGPAMHETLLIDADGNIDPSTPFIFEYDTVTKLQIIRTDIEHLTIQGGIFTTIAAHGADGAIDENLKKIKKFGYVNRGFAVNRSYTTVKNMRHYIEGEVTTEQHAKELRVGAHYQGFFTASYANEVIFDSCVLTGRRYYKICGTYDFSASHVNIIRLVNCTQSNFIMKNEAGEDVYSMAISPLTGTRYCWGIGGTNFCKNMEYIGCTLSRFDAHQGLMNGKIIDTNINFIALTGKGRMQIENVNWYSVDEGITNNAFVYLRGDYGSTWEGDIIVKNVNITADDPENFAMVYHSYGNFEYGYICTVPSLDVDNVKINGFEEGASIPVIYDERSVKKEPALHLPMTTVTPFEKEDGTLEYVNHNPVCPPRYLKFKNSNYKFTITEADFYKNTELSGVEKVNVEEYENGK